MWYNVFGEIIAARTNEPSIQWTLATCMFLPGLACVVIPRKLLSLSFKEEQKKDINNMTLLVFQCFGMQACLVGTVLGTCRMTEQAYQSFAAAMVPFFGFNYYYYFVKPIFKPLPMLADFVNNVVMSQLALAGAMLLKRQATNKKE